MLKTITVASLAALTASSAFADAEIIITGATAFRKAAHEAIRNLMTNETYAYLEDSDDIDGTDRALFVGEVAGISGTVTIRTSWSGSTGGIASVATGVPVEVMDDTNTTSVSGTSIASPSYTTAVAKFTFSDVTQASSATASPILESETVGVIPFEFVANEGFPTSAANMTDQIFNALYSTGSVPLSMFTGDPADTRLVYAVGRANTSGTRASTLAETGYGVFSNVSQWDPRVDDNGTPSDATDDLLITPVLNPFLPETDDFLGNGGYSSSSSVRSRVRLAAEDVSPADGEPDFFIIGYIDAADVSSAVADGAVGMTYNGGEFSIDNVQNGTYTFWGAEQFMNITPLTADEQTFKTEFTTNALPVTVASDPEFVSEPDMNVTRTGDGGPVLPK